MWRALVIMLGVVLGAAFPPDTVSAQNPPTMPSGSMHQMHHPGAAAGTPAMPGQDAFGAIAEVVRLLDADPRTDWSKVNLERR